MNTIKSLQALDTTLRECEQDSLYKIGYFKDVKAAAEKVMMDMSQHPEKDRLTMTMVRISAAIQQRSWAAFNKELNRALTSLEVVVEVLAVLEKKEEKPAPKHYTSLIDLLLDVVDDKVTVTVLDTEGNNCMALCADAVKHMVQLARATINCNSDDTSVYKIHWLEGGESSIRVEVV